MTNDSHSFRLPDSPRSAYLPLGIGLIGLLLSGIGYFTDPGHFFHSYLVSFMYWVTIGLGALFFTMLHHLTNAKWSVVLRRLSENVMSALPLMAVFAIPLVFGLHDLYHWSHAEAVAEDPILQAKAPYLNPTFFIIRLVFYFVVWFLLTYQLNRISNSQDQGGQDDHRIKMRRVSAPGMLLFALTTTFAAFDWLMSLDPHWYSTIFGAYVYAGAFLSGLSFFVLAAAYQRRQGVLKDIITVEHYHDTGKLMLAFVIFWGYMAFSQYFLIWYANIPEETVWFLERWEGGWKGMSLVIIFGHFAVPFLALIFRATKRNVVGLSVVSLWILLMHWVDLHWVVFPNLYHHGPHFSWMDVTTMAGIGGIFVWYFWRRQVARPLVPVGDPGLERSIQFTN